MLKGLYKPSKDFPHDLHLRLYVENGKVFSGEIFMHAILNVDYENLLKIGYPKDSVLGRFIRLDIVERRIRNAKSVESIDLSYSMFRYVSSATRAGVFRIKIKMSSNGEESGETESFECLVTSGLDYVSDAGESEPPGFEGENTLMEPPFSWETLTEKNGSRMFYSPTLDGEK